MAASSALGSKPDAQTSMLIFPAGVFLLILTFLPFVYIIPYYINMILQVRDVHTCVRSCMRLDVRVHRSQHIPSDGARGGTRSEPFRYFCSPEAHTHRSSGAHAGPITVFVFSLAMFGAFWEISRSASQAALHSAWRPCRNHFFVLP